MRKAIQGLMLVAVAVAVAGTAAAYTGTYVPGAGINNTPHDLGTAKNGMNYVASPSDAPLNRICIFCHAPHNTYRLSPANGGPGALIGSGPQAIDAFTYLPLWNHTLPTTIPPYVMYQNGAGAPQVGPKAAQAILNGMAQPGGVSLLCLSCHDGSIAVNSYGNASQPPASVSAGTTLMATGYLIGKDFYLGNHHPIGFDYDAVVAADPEIRDAGVAMMTGTTFVRDHLAGNGAGGNTMLECASCHSVHNTGNSGESLLWRSDQNSELCLTCHAKGTYTAP